MIIYSRFLVVAFFIFSLLQPSDGFAAEQADPANRGASDASIETISYEIYGGSAGGGFNRFIGQLNKMLANANYKIAKSKVAKDKVEKYRLTVNPVVSKGSVANLDLFANRKDSGIEFALSHSDVAYYTYEGKQQYKRNQHFRAVLPMTKAYQQVLVRADSGINTIKDLSGKVVAMGSRGSGSFIQGLGVFDGANIKYVIESMPEDLEKLSFEPKDGLEITIIGDDDYALVPYRGGNFLTVMKRDGQPSDSFNTLVKIRYMGSGPGLRALHKECIKKPQVDDLPRECKGSSTGCEDLPGGCIDALLLTGSLRTKEQMENIRIIPVPEYVLKEMSKGISYYSIVEPPKELKDSKDHPFTAKMLSVTTYLLAHNKAKAARVKKLTKTIVRNWDLLGEDVKDLVDIDEAVKRQPIPFHSGAKEYLLSVGMITSTAIYWQVMAACLVTLLGAYAYYRYRPSYDRLGRTSTVRSHYFQISSDYVAQIVRFVVVVGVGLFVLSFFVWVLELLEAGFAADANTKSMFTDKDLGDSMIWVFTFMTTGYEDKIYPASSMAKVVAAFIGLIGVAAPLGAIYQIFTIRQNRKLSRERGESSHPLTSLQDHTLICGWNSKVPGLVYSMTGEDAPEKLCVVVVAEIDEEFPLRKYKFDQRYVHYCRGDSADFTALSYANAKDAKNAIIMTGENKVKTTNAGSALTALALKSVNPDIFIAGELGNQSNIDNFRAAGVQATINGRYLSEQLIALACNNPNIVDFVLDTLTYDDFDECNSLTVSSLCGHLGLDASGLSAGELFQNLQAAGMNMLGIDDAGNSLVLAGNGEAPSAMNSLLTSADQNAVLEPNDKIIFMSNDIRRLSKNTADLANLPLLVASEQRIFVKDTRAQKVLLVGERSRARGIEAALGLAFDPEDIIEAPIVADTDGDDRQVSLSIETRLNAGDYDCIVLLNGASGMDAIDHDTSYLGDAEVIMRCKLAKAVTARRGDQDSLTIVGEINLQENLVLIENAGVDAVVPTGILVQRFLAKPMFDQGHVIEMLAALMGMHESNRLRSMRLDDDHPLVGIPFNDALRTVYADGRVIACVPDGNSDALKNYDGDFKTHFVTTPANGDDVVVLGSGDVIVSILGNSG